MRQYQTEIGMGRGAAKMKTLTSPIVLVRKTALSAWYCYKFGSKDLHTNLIILEEIRSRLAEKKEEVVEHIETKVKQADSDKDRKTLINLKRDIFNLRQKCINSIEEHLGTLKKYDLDHVVESFKAHYMELLTKESEVNFQYEQLYHHERNHIVSTYKNNVELFKALKFIHPTIMDKSRNYFSKPVEEHNAKLRKLDSTLAKVLTRAAHKTSPFSTLTYVGVGYWSQKSAPEEGGANVNTHYTVTRFNQAYILRAFEKMLTYPEFQKKATFGFVDTLVLYEGKFYWTILIDQPEIRKKVYKTVDSMITVNAAPSLVSFYHKFTYKKNFTLDEVFSFFREVGYPEEKIYELFKNLFDRQFIVPAVYLHQQSDCIIEECIRVIEELGVEGERVEYILAVLKKIKEELMIFDRLDNIEQYESFKRIEHQFLDLSKYLELDHITGKEVLYQDALMTEKEIFQPSNWEQVNESLLAYQQFTKLFDVAARFQLIMGEAFYKQFGNRRVKVSEYEEQILDVILNEVINRKDLWALSIEQDNEQYESHEVNMLNHLKNEFLQEFLTLHNGEKKQINVTSDIYQKYTDRLPEAMHKHERTNSFFIQKTEEQDQSVVINNFYAGNLVFYLRFIKNLQGVMNHSELQQYIEEVLIKKNYLDIFLSYGFNANLRPAITANSINLSNNRFIDKSRFNKVFDWHDIEFQLNPETKKLELFVENEKVNIYFFGTLMVRMIPSVAATLHLLSFSGVLFQDLGYVLINDYLKKVENQFFVKRFPRITFNDHLVIARERWLVNKSAFEGILQLEGLALIQELTSWLRANHIPTRAFVFIYLDSNSAQEDINTEKPQYMDFTSPILLDVLKKMVQDQKYFIIEEVLPDMGSQGNQEEHVKEYVFEHTILEAEKC